jgi:mRNA interferase HicA
MSDSRIMKGSEFIRKLKKLAKARNIDIKVEKKRGKGSHMTLYFGDRFTIIRNPKDELKTGTLKAMLVQLGIKEDEL